MRGEVHRGHAEAMLRQFEQHLTDKDWSEAQEGVDVKLVPGPEGERRSCWLAAPTAGQREGDAREVCHALEKGLQKCRPRPCPAG